MGRLIESSAVLRVEPALAWAVLCDFDQWQEWMPAVRRSQVLVREGDIAIIEMVPVESPRKILLEVIESPGEELRFTEVGRWGSDAVKGRCCLSAGGDGSFGTLAVEVDPGGAFWRRARRRLAGSLLPSTLEAWGQRCIEIAASDFADDPRDKHLLFEILDRDSELILRLGDREFRLCEVERP